MLQICLCLLDVSTLILFNKAQLTRTLAHAVVSCPGGPTTKTVRSPVCNNLWHSLTFDEYIGRVGATAAAPPNQLPAPNVTAADAKAHFLQAGFSSQDLKALIGAHTAA